MILNIIFNQIFNLIWMHSILNIIQVKIYLFNCKRHFRHIKILICLFINST